MKVLKKLFRYFTPYMGQIVLYIVMGLIVVALGMLMPKVQELIFDNLFTGKPFDFAGLSLVGVDLLVGLGIVMIGQSLIRQTLHYFRIVINARTAQLAVNAMRQDLFDNLINQSQRYLHTQNTGNLMTVINGDPETVKNFFIGTIPQMFEVIVGFAFATVMLCTIHPLVFFSSIIAMPVVAYLSRRAGKRIRPFFLDIRDQSADLSRRTQENINGIRIVKAFNNEELEIKEFEKHNKRLLQSHFDYLKEYVRSYLPMDLCSALPYIMVNIVGAILIFNDQMTIGQLVSVGGYLGYIINLFSCMPSWISVSQQSITSASKIMDLLARGSELADKPDLPDYDLKGDIKLENVTMSFDGKAVLKDINIDLPLGKTLGIMGKTGSGKTTLINVLMRFYDPTKGSITVDGVDMRNIKLEQTRKVFAPVMQDVFLFSETVEKNIAFFDPDATEQTVQWAAKTAQADRFIINLPDGYQTVIGERGMGLSGGQKQRISIARAILKNAPVMIMDDASSALDMETEQELTKSLKKELKGHTVITIAHRVSSVKECDEIIYLEDGKIVERGTHEQLLALKGRYYQVFTEQYGELIAAVEGVQ